MTVDYYFKKWKETLGKLNYIVELDLEYQTTKAHDQQICEAAHRINSILVNYIVIYKDTLDCLQHNLQIQKTEHIYHVVKAVEARIIELKEKLRKLEGAYNQLLINGLIDQKLTPFDVEFTNAPSKYERPEDVKELIREALEKAKKEIEERNQELTTSQDYKENDEVDNMYQNIKWWEDTDTDQKVGGETHGLNMTAIYEVKELISEETLERNKQISLIQAHERSRQIIKNNIQQKQKREIWEKELRGTLMPPASMVLRERSARLIQRVIRYYFEMKREHISDCKLEEILNINLCSARDTHNLQMDLENTKRCADLYKKYKNQWEDDCQVYKQHYLNKNHEDIADDYRSFIRNWFYIWYEEVNFFHNIPKDNVRGVSLIISEEVPTPSEWLEKYEQYLETKKANKNKSAYQLKQEKLQAKDEAAAIKRELLKQKKLDADLLKKIMKNPMLHPGYTYPMSKKTDHIKEAVDLYEKNWKDLDMEETLDIKQKYNKLVDQERLCAEAKMEICQSVNNDTRVELKALKRALKDDYKESGESMPEEMKEKKRRVKKKQNIHIKINEQIREKLTALALNGHLKEYPQYKLEDFLGDVNFAGADLRCDLQRTPYFGGDFRAFWWEMCRDALHGYRRILLVGSEQSGKTTLVHIMATINDTTLYEINPSGIEVENQNVQYLQQLVNSIAECAKTTQPSIIYIRHIYKLFYSKVPPNEAYTNFEIMKRFFIKKLFKKIHKHDKITIIGSCIEPWTVKSKQMLKKFPYVFLLPETNYSTTYLILKKWMMSNRIVPRDLNINSLAYLLQGYSFGYLKHSLDDFLTADRIVRIAAHGLQSQEIYNYILEDEKASKIDYNRYVKWYTDNTYWGKLETKRFNEQIEFKLLVQKWEEKMKKKKRK